MSGRRNNNEIVELSISAIGFEGVAIARKDELVYFVKGVVPGDKITAQVKRKRKNHAEARLVEVLEMSPDRVDAVCSHFGVCGGCSWQNLKYSEQLRWKKQHVRDAFERIGKVGFRELHDTMPAPKQFNYRNKMEFSFGASRWLTDDEINSESDLLNKDFALGLHIPGRFDKILNIDECHIHPSAANEVLNSIRNKAVELGLSGYHQREHRGFLRNLVFRHSEANNEMMVILITTSPETKEEIEFVDWLFDELKVENKYISSLLHVVNDTWSPVANGRIERCEGQEYITEKIHDVDYRISPFSFFQTNSGQLNLFISKIIETAKLRGDEKAWDLYCGTGSITLPAAASVSEITGIELVESSILDARANAELNGINNVSFHCADLHGKGMPELINSLDKPEVVFIDPPRAGMHNNLTDMLNQLKIEKIVYVSCNPSTQARDCALLNENYEVLSLQPVDMFPQTYHVENIALLKLRK
jgi:23S rRNA (uracil1939-C5)-methyltransferase